MKMSLMEMSVNLMFYGMGVVFLFLIVAVFAIFAMSNILNRFFQPDPVEATAARRQRPAQQVDPKIVKAIQLALDKHRGR